MEQILLVGDSHGNLKWMLRILDWANDRGIKKVVQLGDFGFYFVPGKDHDKREALAAALQTNGQELYVVPGNHDNYDEIEKRGALRGDQMVAMFPRCIFLPRGYSWEWSGKKFLACGGAVSIDKRFRTPGVSYWDQETISQADVDRCAEVGKVDVLLTHDAPNSPQLDAGPKAFSNEYHIPYKTEAESQANRKAVDAIVEATEPTHVFHGHYHWRYDGETPSGVQVHGLAHDANWEDLSPAMKLGKDKSVSWGLVLTLGGEDESTLAEDR